MKLLEKIVLAQDFGKSSKNVVASAIEFAKVFQSVIVPVHILPTDILNEKVKLLLNETANEKLEETAKQIKDDGVAVGEPILEFNTASEGIVQAAVSVNANIIITGSGETQKADKLQLGTTTTRIIQKSEKPVFVIKEGVILNVHHILCPVDFSNASKRALKNALTMARRFKSELTILAVCELQATTWFASEDNTEKENELQFKRHQEEFASFLKEFNFTDINWTKESPKGIPAEEILTAISRKMIDLLVIGTTGRSGLNRLLMGSVTEKVIREVPCSFLTLKAEDAIILQLETNIRDIEKLNEMALNLMKDGFYEESLGQFEYCLQINNMHVPAYFNIAKVYDKLNDSKKAEHYRKWGQQIKDRMWYARIEEEARKSRGQ